MTRKAPKTLKLGELLDLPVVHESGVKMGRVHDVRGELRGGRLVVTGLIVGRHALLERYGCDLAGRSANPTDSAHDHDVIDWAQVREIGKKIVVN
jgi:sporulation protein YlmC with PRC-barrel domain